MNNLINILHVRASEKPEQLAYIFLKDGESQEEKLTYKELLKKSLIIANKLRSSIPIGSTVLLLYPQGLEFITAFLGCLDAGMIAVPAYPPKRNQKMSRLEAIIRDSQTKAILTTSSLLDNIKQRLTDTFVSEDLQYFSTDDLSQEAETHGNALNITADSLAFLQYTSGSTGTPKGVMISHGNIVNNSAYIKTAFELTSDSVSVTWLPNFHDMGLIDGIIQPLYTGCLGVILSPEAFLQKPIRWLQAISRYRGTHSGGPNLGYDLCVNKITVEQQEKLDLSNWLSAYNGAEPVRRNTLEDFTAKFRTSGFSPRYFYPCYGMAEATLMISGGRVEAEPVYLAVDGDKLVENVVAEANTDTQKIKQLVGCGQSWLDTKIMIVNRETRIPCEEKQIGEIWISGYSIAKGYWCQPEQTAATFEAKLANTESPQFLRTGDLGFIDNGELFITGRQKDLIIIWGKNHYPQDIEDTVQKSHPSLRPDCGAAFSIEKENQEKLVIVQEVDRTYINKLDINEVVTAIQEAVSLNHDLQVYAIALIKPATIAKTSSGKIQRHLCRQSFMATSLTLVGEWEQSLTTTAAITETPSVINQETITTWLVTKLANFLGLESDQLEIESSFSHYGLDSSVALTLTGELETWLNLDLEPTLFWEYTNIAELTQYLREELNNENN